MDVLLVEDSAASAYLVERLLRRRQHTVTIARTGAEGVRAAHARRFDIVLLDLRLPDGDGCDFVARLAAGTGGEPTPVLAVSAHALATEQRRAIDVGCMEFIEKPIDIATFVDRVEAAVAFARVARQRKAQRP